MLKELNIEASTEQIILFIKKTAKNNKVINKETFVELYKVYYNLQ